MALWSVSKHLMITLVCMYLCVLYSTVPETSLQGQCSKQPRDLVHFYLTQLKWNRKIGWKDGAPARLVGLHACCVSHQTCSFSTALCKKSLSQLFHNKKTNNKKYMYMMDKPRRPAHIIQSPIGVLPATHLSCILASRISSAGIQQDTVNHFVLHKLNLNYFGYGQFTIYC